MLSKPLTRLTAIIATLALALATPVAFARPHHSACASHAGARVAHATRACAHAAPTTTNPHGRHKASAHHAKGAPKHGHARVPHPTSATQPASCEDGSAPLFASGEASCIDGSEPACESGTEPIAGASGTLLCPAADNGRQDGEASCEAAACTFDSEGLESPEEDS